MNILSVLELLTKHTQYNLGSLLPQAMVNIFESGFYTLMANGSAAGCRHDGHLQVVRLHVHECLLLVRAVVWVLLLGSSGFLISYPLWELMMFQWLDLWSGSAGLYVWYNCATFRCVKQPLFLLDKGNRRHYQRMRFLPSSHDRQDFPKAEVLSFSLTWDYFTFPSNIIPNSSCSVIIILNL